MWLWWSTGDQALAERLKGQKQGKGRQDTQYLIKRYLQENSPLFLITGTGGARVGIAATLLSAYLFTTKDGGIRVIRTKQINCPITTVHPHLFQTDVTVIINLTRDSEPSEALIIQTLGYCGGPNLVCSWGGGGERSSTRNGDIGMKESPFKCQNKRIWYPPPPYPKPRKGTKPRSRQIGLQTGSCWSRSPPGAWDLDLTRGISDYLYFQFNINLATRLPWRKYPGAIHPQCPPSCRRGHRMITRVQAQLTNTI